MGRDTNKIDSSAKCFSKILDGSGTRDRDTNNEIRSDDWECDHKSVGILWRARSSSPCVILWPWPWPFYLSLLSLFHMQLSALIYLETLCLTATPIRWSTNFSVGCFFPSESVHPHLSNTNSLRITWKFRNGMIQSDIHGLSFLNTDTEIKWSEWRISQVLSRMLTFWDKMDGNEDCTRSNHNCSTSDKRWNLLIQYHSKNFIEKLLRSKSVS